MSLVISKRPDGSVIISCGDDRVRIPAGSGIEILPKRKSKPVHGSGTVIIQYDRAEGIETDLDNLPDRLTEMMRSGRPDLSGITLALPADTRLDVERLSSLTSTLGPDDPGLNLRFIDPDE